MFSPLPCNPKLLNKQPQHQAGSGFSLSVRLDGVNKKQTNRLFIGSDKTNDPAPKLEHKQTKHGK